MGDVIHFNFGDRQNEGFADQCAAELMEALRADFDAAELPDEGRAQYRAIARDLMDQIAHRHCDVPFSLPMPAAGASQAEIDAITAAVAEVVEGLYLKLASMAAETFMQTVRAACAISSRP
jgi:hypothetical protein